MLDNNVFSEEKESGKTYYSERIIEQILRKFHYTTEVMLKLIITYIKLTEGGFPLTIYISFYLTV